jgi:pyruvate/2-oxoglutarate dehydrogenase complex dihydrolipoamide acyltransferase (E2) component
VQRTVDETGNIIETTLDENGELLDEDITGNLTDLPAAEGFEEYVNEAGSTVRTVQDESGTLIELQLGEDGSILDLQIPPSTEETTEEIEESSQQSGGQQDTEEGPDATEAAKQKAEELGVDMSQIEGSGAEGRITVKDVVSASDQG